MNDVTVREARSEDVDGILAVAERGWRDAYGSILAPETIDRALSEWYDPASTRAMVGDESVAYFVAIEDGSVVGYASSGPDDDDGVAVLGAIYVDPDLQGEGIGTALLDRFEAWCRRRGFDAVAVQVLSENDGGVPSIGSEATRRSRRARSTFSVRPSPRRPSGRTSREDDRPRPGQC